ncbi:YjcZ family sporulation protein [Lysinibacillus contaminans]|uniref:YjcZ family sporulation protein n=1 Tax=Lysinibacillus contaminans TaxID=1293441 RepID=UPI0009EC4A4A|nr:YjcZ family sporulation protein [Lysinibacillus contaminans]
MGNYGYSGYNSSCGGYGMDYCMDYGKDNSSTFVLIVVLFILLIIVGATFMHKGY